MLAALSHSFIVATRMDPWHFAGRPAAPVRHPDVHPRATPHGITGEFVHFQLPGVSPGRPRPVEPSAGGESS
jgi:hypothetical protein